MRKIGMGTFCDFCSHQMVSSNLVFALSLSYCYRQMLFGVTWQISNCCIVKIKKNSRNGLESHNLDVELDKMVTESYTN